MKFLICLIAQVFLLLPFSSLDYPYVLFHSLSGSFSCWIFQIITFRYKLLQNHLNLLWGLVRRLAPISTCNNTPSQLQANFLFYESIKYYIVQHKTNTGTGRKWREKGFSLKIMVEWPCVTNLNLCPNLNWLPLWSLKGNLVSL